MIHHEFILHDKPFILVQDYYDSPKKAVPDTPRNRERFKNPIITPQDIIDFEEKWLTDDED